jgi:hypothetical protein
MENLYSLLLWRSLKSMVIFGFLHLSPSSPILSSSRLWSKCVNHSRSMPRIFYTDNPSADKHFLETIFESLKADVVPVKVHPTLKPYVLPEHVVVAVHSSVAEINGVCDSIADDVDVTDDTASVHISRLLLMVSIMSEWSAVVARSQLPSLSLHTRSGWISFR